MSYYREQLETWLKHIVVKADSVLDVGGSAGPVNKRVASWDVKKYEILDNLVEVPKADPTYKLDINYPIKLNTSYDIIFCLEVMEYVFNPVLALMNIYLLLKTQGIAYISFPSIYPVHNPKEIDSLRYTYQGIIRILGASGFSKWEVTPRIATQGRAALGEFYHREGMHPVRNDNCIYDIGYLIKCYK